MAEMRAVFATAAPRLTEFPIPATVTRPDAQCRALLSFAAHCDIVFLLFGTIAVAAKRHGADKLETRQVWRGCIAAKSKAKHAGGC